jgi:lipoate-protein ligase B
MKSTCIAHWLGQVPYEEAWQLQDRLAGEIARGERQPTLLLLEHPHTYTFGRRGQADNLLWDEAELARRDIAVHWVDRGGDVTYHGPGQLVGYPLLPLAPGGLRTTTSSDSADLLQADFIGYLRKLELVLITALADVGVVGEQVPGFTGVWVTRENDGDRIPPPGALQNLAKIAAIGVKVDVKGISRHGFALNINPDMSYWDGIIGCGLKGYHETSLAELLDPTPSTKAVSKIVVSAFKDIFGYTIEWQNTVVNPK